MDLRFGVRMLSRNPGFTVVAVIVLMLGIGANTAIFSVVNTVLLKPLPYDDPDSLVVVWERNTAIAKPRDNVAPRNYQDWRSQNTVFADIGAYRYGGFALTGVEDPEQIVALTVSSSLFRVLRAEAAIGRTFTEEEEQRKDRVLVLRHEFWRRRFGGDRGIVGKSIMLTGASFTVVGVMPAGFRFPEGNPVDIYSPLVFNQGDLLGRRSHSLTVIARLKPDVGLGDAQLGMDAIARAIAAQDSTSNPAVSIVRAHDLLVEDVRLGLVVLLGTVGFVLLIACANLANLLLARSASRRREFAVRTALGAGRFRLARQVLTESLLLAFLGGLAGILLASWVLDLLVRFSPRALVRVQQVAIDANVLLFVSALVIVTGVLFGTAPIALMSRSSVSETVRQNTLGAGGGFRRNAGGSLLVVAEVALSLILATGAGLMIRSLVNAQRLNLGFDPSDILTAQIFLPPSRYPVDPGQFRPAPPAGTPAPPLQKPAVFFAQLIERAKALPGVESVGAVTSLPLNPVGIDFDLPVVVQGRPRPRAGEEPQADFRVATPDYFRTMRIPLLRGRGFTEFDGPARNAVVIINDAMARQMFSGEEPLGQQIVLYSRPRDIVGIVGSVRHRGFSQESRPEMFLPYGQFSFGGMTLVVRSAVGASGLTAALKREVAAIDGDQPVYRIRLMEEYLAASIAQPRFTTVLLGCFALLAMVLAVIGVYGVISYTVTQRTQEIGVRMALGADRRDVVSMVMGHGMKLSLLGIVIGLGAAAAGTRLMTGLLFGITATDPATFAMAALALVMATLAATFIPARRATRVDPLAALRYQ